MNEGVKKCPECGRTVPEYWCVPFTTKWGLDPATNRWRSLKGLYGKEGVFADCDSCCDKPLDQMDLAQMGVNWGGLRTS